MRTHTRTTTHSHTDGGHSHYLPTTFGKAFAIGIALNIVYVAAQVLFGLFAHSAGFWLSDAGHNLGDVLGLFMAWGASQSATRSDLRVTLTDCAGVLLWLRLPTRFFYLSPSAGLPGRQSGAFGNQPALAESTVICVAAVGIVINGVTAMLFASGRKGDLNIRGAFVDMAADAIVSGGVVVAGIVWILLSGWWWLDPVVSLAINAVIVFGTWGRVRRDSVNMALDAVPPGVDVGESYRNYFRNLSGVTDFHHLHIWSFSTTQAALTVHLIKPVLPEVTTTFWRA